VENGPYLFAPLVSQVHGWNAIAELDILFLRPSEPGALIGHGGDLDNRIKTLLDALRMPNAEEIPNGAQPSQDEWPFYCLLQDDALVTALSVTTDRLLAPKPTSDVELIIRVSVKITRRSFKNSVLG